MGADVSADGNTPRLGRGQFLQGAGAGQGTKMDPSAGLLGHLQIPGQGHRLRRLRDTGQAQAGADPPLMGTAVIAQEGVLRAHDDGQAEGGGVLHGSPQHLGVDDGTLGLAHDGAAGQSQGGHLAELLARQAMGEGTGGDYPRLARHRRGAGDELGHRRGVDDGCGIRRAAQAGDAPGRGGRGLTGDGALVLLAGFPQPGAEVDKARADHLAGGVQDPVWRKARRRLAHRQDLAIGEVQVKAVVDTVGGVDEPPVADADATGHRAGADTRSDARRVAEGEGGGQSGGVAEGDAGGKDGGSARGSAGGVTGGLTGGGAGSGFSHGCRPARVGFGYQCTGP